MVTIDHLYKRYGCEVDGSEMRWQVECRCEVKNFFLKWIIARAYLFADEDDQRDGRNLRYEIEKE